MSVAIEVQEVSKRFHEIQAVNALSFTVRRGDLFGFLGPNGSGKSTTLRMLMSLIFPDTGDIRLLGMSWQSERNTLMQRVGCMIEQPDFYSYLSAKENLQLFARAHRLSWNDKQYEALFEQVGLHGRERDKVHTYSQGMRQRLGIARVLLHDPELILLDEPNTGLDPQGILDLRHLMQRLNREAGKTILFSSHILDEVQTLCNHVVVIHKGRCMVQGAVDDLLSGEHLLITLEPQDIQRCIQYMSQSAWQQFFQGMDDKQIFLQMSKQQIPALVQDLARQELAVMRVDYRNRLEDYFLKITQQA